MKRKRQTRILLGILLAALLLLPGGMRIKAEEVVPGEQPAQEEVMPAVGLENVENTETEIKDPTPEKNEEKLPVEPEPGEPEPGEPLLEEEPLFKEASEEEVSAEEEIPVEEEVLEAAEQVSEMRMMAAPLEVPDDLMAPMTAEIDLPKIDLPKTDLPKLDLKSFDCDFIWGVGYGDELFDFNCKFDIGSKINWDGIDLFLCKDKIFDPEIEFECITVEKIWKNDESEDRPYYILFDLYAGEPDGKIVAVLPIVSNHSDTWKTKILVPVKIHGKVINYSVDEHSVIGYESKVEGFKITNTKTNEPKMRDITVKKVWKEADKVLKPASVNFWLMNGDIKVGDMRTIMGKDGWEVTLKEAVFDENGNEINYSIEEVAIQGYESVIIPGCEEDNTSAATLSMDMNYYESEDKCPDFTIINTFKNERIITLEKVWDDANYEGRPVEVTFTLYQNDVELKDVKITKANEWKETLTIALNDDEGEPFEYEILEKIVPEGYEASVNGFTITNKRGTDTPVMIDIKGEKTWLDDGTGRPEFINVNLMAKGEIVKTVKVEPVAGKWLYDFGEHPKYDDEKQEIVYTVSEETVDGYELIPGENFDIANRRTDKITIKGEKTWDDLMNRPASITVYLERDGETFEEVEVKADDMGKWLYSFKETAQFDEKGMPYTFTVSEKYILGYEAKVTGFNILNVQQRATMRVLKVNEAGTPLAGAVFEVRDLSGKVLKTFTTGADGLFLMDLPLGMYRLAEITSPAGYAENTVPVLVILFKAGEVKTVEVVNTIEQPTIIPAPIPTLPGTGGKLPSTGGRLPITGGKLPSTGGGSEMGFYFLGMASFAAGLLTMKKKKN